MDLRASRINTDLHLLYTQIAHPPGFRCADHYPIGLDSDIEFELARIFQDFKEVAPHQNLAATESQKESPSLGQLFKNIFDFGGRHLTVNIVIQIAMNATFVTTIGDVQMDTQ